MRSTGSTRLRQRRGVTAPIAVVFIAAGCGAYTTPPPSPTPPPPATSADQHQLDDFAVEFVYRQYWAVLSIISRSPPAQWPGILAAVTTEPELSRQLAAAHNRADHGTPDPTEPTLHITNITGAATTQATLYDCQTTASGTSRGVIATIVRPTNYSTWKVANITIEPTIC